MSLHSSSTYYQFRYFESEKQPFNAEFPEKFKYIMNISFAGLCATDVHIIVIGRFYAGNAFNVHLLVYTGD